MDAWNGKCVRSHPFDIGANTRASLFKADPTNPKPKLIIKATATGKQAGSESNGSLMRITPLAIWSHKLPIEDLAKVVLMEVSLTHSSEVIQHSTLCYCIAIHSLLNHPGDAKLAYNTAKQWALDVKIPALLDWFSIVESEEEINAKKNQGWAKIAFIYAFKFLLAETDYAASIKSILIRGGDTDTNACIVGGLIGAFTGIKGIPEEQVQILLACKPNSAHNRPSFLWTSKHAIKLIENLLKIAPTSLTIKT